MPIASQNRDLLDNRPFLILLGARTISMAGMAFSPVALAFGVLRLPGADATTLSLVMASQAVPMVVFMLAGGVIADRYPRALVLLAGELLAGLAWGSIGVLMLTGFTPIWLLCLAAALAGVGGSMVYPAFTGIIPDLVPEQHRQKGNAWLAMGASVARLGGLIGGGVVVVWLGGGWAMVAAGSLYLVATTLVVRLPVITDGLAADSDNPIRQLIDGWAEFSSRQWLWVVVSQFSLMVMILHAAQGVLGPYLAETELGGPADWTIILTGEAVGAMAGVGIALAWKPKRPILAGVLVMTVSCSPLLLLGAGYPVWMVVVGMFFTGMAFSVFGVLWMTTMQNEVPAESLSRVASYDALGSLMLGPVGLLVAGPAILAFGVRPSLIGAGVILIGVTMAGLISPQVRNLRAKDPQLR